MNTIASAPGTYVLMLECKRAASVSIGKLGQINTCPGYYLYVGSAFGAGGIQARVDHHSRPALKPHWHIDYLRTAAGLEAAWCKYDARLEHEWAQALNRCEAMDAPLKGFGSSDCDCSTHMFFSKTRPTLESLESVLNTRLSVVKLSV